LRVGASLPRAPRKAGCGRNRAAASSPNCTQIRVRSVRRSLTIHEQPFLCRGSIGAKQVGEHLHRLIVVALQFDVPDASPGDVVFAAKPTEILGVARAIDVLSTR
jgi:hypothetical protein